jgi:hypothetical protein
MREKLDPRLINMAGVTYGRLTGISYEGNFRWKFSCSCGKVVTTRGVDVRKGKSRSCGCATVEATTARNTTHGFCKFPEFSVWRGMLQRCYNRKRTCFDRYGGRGIFVCQEWRENFLQFLKDMGSRPSAKHTIERKENNGPYSPDNCVWATAKQQAQNRRPSHFITHNGERLTVAQWSDKTGINYGTLMARIKCGKTGDLLFSKYKHPRRGKNVFVRPHS